MARVSRDYRKLQVWDKAHALTLMIYEHTKMFPREELYGLTSQMRRAAASVPTNVAEGCGRGGNIELARFMTIAEGSGSELSYLLILARDLKFLSDVVANELMEKTTEVCRMLAAYSAKLAS